MHPPRGEIPAYYAGVVLKHETDDCLIWPYHCTGDGYASMKRGGKQILVSRAICTHLYGPPPSPSHEAAHSCGNGMAGCVNPNHLRWATRAENESDKFSHGTVLFGEAAPAAKLSESDAVYLRSLPRNYDRRSEARRLGVAPNTISQLRTGKTWKHLQPPA